MGERGSCGLGVGGGGGGGTTHYPEKMTEMGDKCFQDRLTNFGSVV